MRPRASATAPSFCLLAQHAVHGRPRRAGHRGDVLLRERNDTVLVRRGQLEEPPTHARLRIDVVRLDDAIGRAAELLGEQSQEHVLHAGVLALQEREVVAEHRARLAGLERLDGRRAARVGEEQRELAEALSRPEDVDEHAVAERRQHARAEAAAHDEVQRVGGIVAMEDDLAPRERPPSRDREQLPHVLGGQIGEQRPLHAASLCNGGDIRNVTSANDAARRRSYSRDMRTTRRENTMKRIATIGAIVTAFAVAPSVAAAGNVAAQSKPQVTAQVVGVQVAKVQRAQAAVSVQRHLVQVAQAKRISLLLRPQLR